LSTNLANVGVARTLDIPHRTAQKNSGVKCVEGHPPNMCPLNKKEQPTCTNYGSEHPANYLGCPYYKESAREKRFTTNVNVRNFVNPNQTFASFFSNKASTTFSSNTAVKEYLKLSQNLFGRSFIDLVKEIINFISTVKNVTDLSQKQVMYIEFMMKLVGNNGN
jgi:hypothetical protein